MRRVGLTIKGIVQGVGFRPFVYRLASRYELGGWVLNDSRGVLIEVEGDDDAVGKFLAALPLEKPPLAVLDRIETVDLPLQGETAFVIRHSLAESDHVPMVSPDIATCPDCRHEIFDPCDRRYRYPFTNCTNCGPRYTIIKNVPYDRMSTTMSEFPMCPACKREFEDPLNRRFHAQPNACPVCGPQYRLLDCAGASVMLSDKEDVFTIARRLLASGHVLAVKGVGGYHLACDARNDKAVTLLRSRKVREDKPFAVMCGSLDAIRRRCVTSPEEEDLLSGIVRPIVLLDKSAGYDLAAGVAPANPRIGVMLPYTPAHELLLGPDDIWVMTSGNISDEPISYQDCDALERLAGIADYFLVHNRNIYRRADDSVVRVFQNQPYLLRRSRGYTPAPLKLKRKVSPVLACGGELKNTFCLTHDHQAFISAHIGDLENLPTYDYYVESIAHYRRLFHIAPEIVAHDMHPEYLSTKYALSLDLPKASVQHHHAHVASVMAEHGLDGPVIGVAFDGTGYGSDGTLWGSEFLISDYREFTRAAHCRYIPLPGGTKAIKEPWRLAVWMLHELYGNALSDLDIPFVRNLPEQWPLVIQAAEKKINSPLACGAGRYFDAAAALLGLRSTINYEGQAAVELELAAGSACGEVLPYDITNGSPRQLDFRPTFAALADRLAQGGNISSLSASFHTTMAAAICHMVGLLGQETGIRQVTLTGGVFQNIRLLGETMQRLECQGFSVYLHRQTPANDGGISLGQAVIASERFR